MKSGFQLLKTRPSGADLNTDNLPFELPPLYNLFLETFETGPETFVLEKYIPKGDSVMWPCTGISFQPLEGGEKWLGITNIYSLEKMISVHTGFAENEVEWSKHKLLKIADIGMGGGLFVGTQGAIKDCICRVVWDWNEEYDIVAPNVFQFVQGLVEVKDPEGLFDGGDYSDLIRFWGKTHWEYINTDKS